RHRVGWTAVSPRQSRQNPIGGMAQVNWTRKGRNWQSTAAIVTVQTMGFAVWRGYETTCTEKTTFKNRNYLVKF
ncbi:MAG: hypothetical protein KDA71_11375, partial [Planctomycetales bacterium]|nr:hypothetical protein [Planctomycetales bacterium]